MTKPAYPEDDPRHHTSSIRRMLREAMGHAHEDVAKVNEPHAEALFETTAEVLGGLVSAYDHFEQRSETAWR